MGWCWRKPKKPEPIVEQPKIQSIPQFKPSTFDFLVGIKTKTVPKIDKKERGRINIKELLPNNMFAEYEKLELPTPSVTASDFSSEVFIVLNLLRAAPIFFANNFLETVRARFTDEYTFKSFSNETKTSTFGLLGVDHCINYISEMKPLAPLYWSEALQAAAEGKVNIANGENKQNQDDLGDTIELTGVVYEFTQREADISFEVITSLIWEDYEEMKMLERFWDTKLQYAGISSFVNSIGDNVTRIFASENEAQNFDPNVVSYFYFILRYLEIKNLIKNILNHSKNKKIKLFYKT